MVPSSVQVSRSFLGKCNKIMDCVSDCRNQSRSHVSLQLGKYNISRRLTTCRYHNLKEDEPMVAFELHKRYGRWSCAILQKTLCWLWKGPVIRITPTLLLVSDATKLPEIYNRQANKSKHYISGSFGNVESLFNMQDWKTHARFRKVAAGSYRYVTFSNNA